MNDAIGKLIDQTLLFTPRLGASLLIFIGFCFAAFIARNIVVRFSKKSGLNRDVASLMGNIVKVSIFFFGGVTALGTLGIDVAALVAGLGLTGFALGLAFKDVLSNLIGGILILVNKPFQSDDIISVSGFEGKVIEINLRYTKLQTEDRKILIPNSSLFINTICVLEPGQPIKSVE